MLTSLTCWSGNAIGLYAALWLVIGFVLGVRQSTRRKV
jgi:hypothetical protein